MSRAPTASTDALVGGGEMGARIRDHDWAATPLGPIEGWPGSLLTSLGLVLNAQMPMWLGWGQDAAFFYNDAYVQVLSEAKHPWALGRPAAEVWAEIWHVCGPLAEKVFRDAEAPFVEDVQLFMDRGGYLEEVYYSFSYSPIRDESGRVAGLFCPNTEVTAKLLHARRLRTLAELSANALIEKTTQAACRTVAATLARNPDDVPFALLYLATGDGTRARLEQTVGPIARHPALAPETVELDRTGGCLWPVGEVYREGVARRVDLSDVAGAPIGLGGRQVRQAVVLPVVAAGQERPSGALIVGVSPVRKLDPEYATFYDLVAAQVATALQNAQASEQERQRADALAELDRVKSAFFSNVSHEFRTPLTLMIGPTEDALASPGRALAGESLETVYRNELRLLKLVNALLDFSRLEAGRMKAAYAPVDLAELTRDQASGFRSAIERAGLRFETDITPIGRPVQVDRDMWEKIVLNLLSNALKFTLEGSIRVGLRAIGHHVVLTVADTGTGIPAHELPRLFERFHRIENARARTHEGSGIGLALVHELVHLHGGTVGVDSKLGRGTEFRVTIPVTWHAAEEVGAAGGEATEAGTPARSPRRWRENSAGGAPGGADPRATAPLVAHVDRAMMTYALEAERWLPSAERDPVAAPEGSDETILVVDDNTDMREYVTRLLQPTWRVVAVSDGLAALEVARRQVPDLVLSDVMMPGLDGFGLLGALRAEEATRSVPVILLSARAGDEVRVEGLEAGADDYLVKPFSARELVARVRTHLALSRLRRGAEADRQTLYDIFMQVPAAISVHRAPDLRCVFQNAASLAITDQRGKTLAEVWPDAPPEDDAIHAEVLRTGLARSRYEVAMPAARAGAAPRYWDTTWAPVRLADGTMDGIMAISFEVTDRVEARRVARAIEERRRLAFEAAGTGTWRIDLATGIEERDGGMNRLLGLEAVDSALPLEEFLGRVHPDDRAGVEASLARARQTGAPHEAEMRVLLPGGGVRWLRDVGRAVLGDDGHAVALTGAAADITWRKAAEADRTAAEERLRAALDAAAIGTVFWDVRTGLVVEDDGVRRLFGFGRGEGGSIDQYSAGVHEADRKAWLDGLARSAGDGLPFYQEFRIVRPDGAVRWLLGKGTVARDAAGAPALMTGAMVDITEQRRLAEAALAASRAKDEFLAMLGHELRNPLAPIVTAIQLMKLRGGELTREQRTIERQVQHLTRLVDDLLDISRVTRGLIELKPDRVSVADVVAKAIEIASPLMEQKGHYVSVSVPHTLRVHADPVRLAQVFANLLTNAARYTPPGGQIDVTSTVEGSQVVTRVTDDGGGIAQGMLGRIFDLFVQGGSGTERSEGGLGIGLALVRSLVDMHGGEVTAQSDGPNRGSQFVVKLPSVAPSGEQAAEQPRAAAPAAAGRRVLLVDDNVDAAELLSEALRSMGYAVEVAHDGAQALTLVRDFQPEVAVLDIGLPVMDGYELARRLRAGGLDRCRLIALTGYGQEQDHARSREAGFDVHMVKPVDLDRLAQALSGG